MGSFLTRVVDDDSNGLFDRLVIGVGVETTGSGTFVVTVRLAVDAAAEISQSHVVSLGAGDHVVDVSFPARQVRSLGEDGPFMITSAKLLELAGNRRLLRDVLRDAGQTAAVLRAELQPESVEPLGAASLVAEDDDADGVIERLRLTLGLRLESSASYEVRATLVDAGGREIEVAGVSMSLETGEHAVDLWFDGCAIGAGRHEGPYSAKNLLVSGGRVPFSSSLTFASAELHLEQFPCRGDSSPPVTTATLSPEPNPGGWNNGTVVVRLNASDESGGSGVDRIEHEMTGAQSGHGIISGGSGQAVIGTEGATALTFFAVDAAGNRETAQTLNVRIDRSSPVIEGMPGPDCTLWPPNHQMVHLTTVSASDGLSGLAEGSLEISVTSNEPDDGLGDGSTASDILVDGGEVWLRAEMSDT